MDAGDRFMKSERLDNMNFSHLRLIKANSLTCNSCMCFVEANIVITYLEKSC